jgi:hypothetical protein
MKSNKKLLSLAKNKGAVPVSKAQVRQMLQSAMSVEKQIKFTSLEFSQSTVSTSGLIGSAVYWPYQGVEAYDNDEDTGSQGQRVGNQITMKWMDLNYTVFINSIADYNIYRVILFQWLVPIDHSDEAPVVGDILQITDPYYPWQSPFNFENKSKYHILYDKVGTVTNTGSSKQVVCNKIHVKESDLACKQLRFIGDSEGGASGSLVKGNIFSLIFSDAAVEYPTFKFTSAFYYTDAN